MMVSETDDIVKKMFESHLQNHQEVLEISMRGGEFIFDSVDLLFTPSKNKTKKCQIMYRFF